MKPNKQQLISVLENLASCMETSAEVMKRAEFLQPELRQHAIELSGAWEMVSDWIKAIKEQDV
jgi:hypothetical protein